MGIGENLFNNLLVLAILFILGLIIYGKMTHQTLMDMIRGMRETFQDKTDDLYDSVPNAFQDIR